MPPRPCSPERGSSTVKDMAAYVLAYDSDDDETPQKGNSPSPLRATDATLCAHLSPALSHSRSRLSGEDSQLSAPGASADPADGTPVSAGRPQRSQRPQQQRCGSEHGLLRGLSLTTRSAACAEKLVQINATAATQRERDAALAQLSRFRGAYRDLCRGAPLSVWVRYEEECAAVVEETADFFSYELEELIRARTARTRDVANGKWAPKDGIVAVRLPGFRFVGSRTPLPASTRNICKLSGTWGVEDAARDEEANLYASLTTGERVAITLLSLETDAPLTPPSLGGGEHTSLNSSPGVLDALSPLAIYADERDTPSSPLPTVVPLDRVAASSTSPAASGGARDPGHVRRGGKRCRDESLHSPVPNVARKLRCGSPEGQLTDGSCSSASLSASVMEQRSQKALQHWLQSSQEAFVIPY